MEAASKQTLLNQIWELTQAAKQKDAKLARLEDKVARLEATLQRKTGKRGIRKRLELAALVQSAMAANIADLRDAYARYVEDFLEVLGDIEEIRNTCQEEGRSFRPWERTWMYLNFASRPRRSGRHRK